jgi:DNA end-binding protein Ku
MRISSRILGSQMTMPRSLWNGTIAFGLVRVPVKLHSATESMRIPFRERHASDGAAIEHRRVCVKEGSEVPYGELVKGFEVSAGAYVVLSKEEIAVADGPEARVVEIEHFVSGEEIDPVYYERAYHLSPGKLGGQPYCLLHAALKRSGRVGIGRFVFHNKEHLAAVRAVEDVIVLHTMRFSDELVPEDDLEFPEIHKRPSKLEVDTAQLLIDQLDSEFEPENYENTHRDAVLALIERKARGEAIEAPESEEVTREGDLLTALQASLEAHGGRRRRAGGSAPRAASSARGDSSPSSKGRRGRGRA